MKKLIALLLAVLMIVGMLTACGNKSDEKKDDGNKDTAAATEKVTPTEEENNKYENKGVAVGTILDAPEVTVDSTLEDLQLTFVYNDGTKQTIAGIVVDQQTESSALVYMFDGVSKDNEFVFEITEDGITKYAKEKPATEFTQATTNVETLQAELQAVMSMLQNFTGYTGLLGDNAQYKKADMFAVLAVDCDFYCYEILLNDQKAGTICIDQKTGILLQSKDAQGNIRFNVTELKTSNVQVPQYK